MPNALITALAFALACAPSSAQAQRPDTPASSIQQPTTMPTDQMDPVVKAAIEALNTHDRKAWDALIAPKALFYDDGKAGSIVTFSDNAFGKGNEHFTRIDKVEDNGLHVYGHYRSDTWGDFKTYFKFQLLNGRITRLEVGQANY